MRFILDKGESKGAVVLKGQTISISCIEGGQLADLVFLDYNQGITLDRLQRFTLMCGDKLFNSNEEEILEVTRLDSDAHVILYPGCRRKVYSEMFGQEKDGCREILASELGIQTLNLPSTINLFMDFEINCKT